MKIYVIIYLVETKKEESMKRTLIGVVIAIMVLSAVPVTDGSARSNSSHLNRYTL